MKVEKETLLKWYKKMLHTRFFESQVDAFFAKGMIHGTTHLSIGQEAFAIGSTGALREDDLITSTHRGHGECIGKDADVNLMMAELMGKSNGYCKGKGGSMHIADLEKGNLGANGVVGGGFAIAAGAAMTQQMKKTGKVVLCYFGDGASNEGSFHEALNLASIWKLPVVFMCTNNKYGMSMSTERSMNVETVASRAAAYGMPGVTVPGNDVLKVYEATLEAVERARRGEGPSIVEGLTYRWLGHSKSDANRYRTKEEIEEWKTKCPIKAFEKYLMENKVATREELDAITATAKEDIAQAVAFAQAGSYPGIETLEEDVYA
ncbi:thiamine pyrophosphate-dependent dehydrogenase E1 component subunit alpha [Propionispora hippei]|uniref:Pyruvate dehydrogenase E1 component alpha subunit n=1 Tax=Propionispora hippei DSM 15287 TaxID=1123003 RepID=A0A1M6IMY9_9FIRM|nr:thiamine pyrophosphate-dependent dehydrogenase E1 component subunit alpha [Propionispora hippei]SHJ35834.1 pyruvate dehydrogenase E1 component alpha subunit [Propionispora hippei DSM 15287]